MTEKKPGKPWVFPLVKPGQTNWGTSAEIIQRGLSLRDWLAGLAMQGLLAQHCDTGLGLEPRHQPDATRLLAGEAYCVADAMLAQRDSQHAADPVVRDEIRLRAVVNWLVRRSNPLGLTNDFLSHDCLTGECDHDADRRTVDQCVDRLVADLLADLGPGPGRE